MNRKEAAELSPIIKAFSEGRPIQYRIKDNKSAKWNDVDKNYHKFSPHSFMYRIKPESKYRPFKDAEECWAEMNKHQTFGWVKADDCYYNIVSISNMDMIIVNVCGDTVTYSFSDALQDNTFVDGAPFGVKVED